MTATKSKLVSSLFEIGQNEYESIVEQGHIEGKRLYDKLIQEATQRLALRKLKNEEEAEFIKKREISRYHVESEMKVNQEKYAMIESLLEEVHEIFEDLSDDEFLGLLDKKLKAQESEEHPRIFVDSKHFSAVHDAKGRMYQVIESADIEQGFVLSYLSYDVNMEFVKVFQYQHEAWVNRFMGMLFNEEV